MHNATGLSSSVATGAAHAFSVPIAQRGYLRDARVNVELKCERADQRRKWAADKCCRALHDATKGDAIVEGSMCA